MKPTADLAAVGSIVASGIAIGFQVYWDYRGSTVELYAPRHIYAAFYRGSRDTGNLSLVVRVPLSNLAEPNYAATVVHAKALLGFRAGDRSRTIVLRWQHNVELDLHPEDATREPEMTSATDAEPFLLPGGRAVTRAVWFVPRTEPCTTIDCNPKAAYLRYLRDVEPILPQLEGIDLQLHVFLEDGRVRSVECALVFDVKDRRVLAKDFRRLAPGTDGRTPMIRLPGECPI